MIYVGSRYEQEDVQYLLDARSNTTRPTVLRTKTNLRLRQANSATRSSLVWNSAYRMDQAGTQLVKDPERWWEIADVNPDLLNPWSISAGYEVIVP